MIGKQELVSLFGIRVSECLQDVFECRDLEEIRFRRDLPLMVKIGANDYFISLYGQRKNNVEDCYIVQREDIEEILNRSCNFSTYAYEKELAEGYLTLPGGHRLGITGEVIYEDNKVKLLKNISGINIRIAKEWIGIAEPFLPTLYNNGQSLSTLVISPPGNGKTTFLRDCIRLMSDGNKYGNGVNISVIDERGEIAGSYEGKRANHLGVRTDILDGCPKREGMRMVLRSMNPQIVAVDEIGREEDYVELQKLSCSGVRLLASLHGNREEFQRKKLYSVMQQEYNFRRFVYIYKMQDGRRNYTVCNGEDNVLIQVIR